LKCVPHCENGVKLNYLLKQDRNFDKKEKKVICADPCYEVVAGGGDSAGGISGGATGAEMTGARAACFFFAFFTTLFLTFFLATFFLAFFGKDKFHLNY
jgi:hypothetical protein